MIIEEVTIFVKETFHEMDSENYPEPEYPIGRILTHVEEQEGGQDVETYGHKIVAVNQIIEDDKDNYFRIIEVLGNGTFSYVYKCQLLSDPRTFAAMKIIKNLPQYRVPGILEVSLHQRLSNAPDHPGKEHVIEPISSFEEEGHIIMVMPLMSRSLSEGIYQNKPLPDLMEGIRNVMEQILLGVQFLHDNGVIHCDLKPDNIVFASESQDFIKIIDLGSASTGGQNVGDYIQSRFYRSPEIMLSLPYSNKIDMWSCGCIAAELFVDFPILACDNVMDSIHSMVSLLGPIPDYIIQSSRNWWNFFDLTREGYRLKMDPDEVIMTTVIYSAMFQQTGPMTLEQIIMSHKEPQNEEELQELSCFSHFVHSLLRFDPNERLSADQALQHPFMTGEEFTGDWAPEPEPSEMIQQGRSIVRSSSMDKISSEPINRFMF